jgi:hypothetical protein
MGSGTKKRLAWLCIALHRSASLCIARTRGKATQSHAEPCRACPRSDPHRDLIRASGPPFGGTPKPRPPDRDGPGTLDRDGRATGGRQSSQELGNTPLTPARRHSSSSARSLRP